jgi:hypothetical protein
VNHAYAQRLERARQLLQRIEGEGPGVAPTADADQLRAADRDMAAHYRTFRAIVTTMDPDTQEQHRRPTLEVAARTMVALMDCRPCPHLHSPQPVFVCLPLHRADCRRCALEATPPPPADEDDRCDWCGRRGVATFRAITYKLGAILIGGDACPECTRALL